VKSWGLDYYRVVFLFKLVYTTFINCGQVCSRRVTPGCRKITTNIDQE